MADKKQITVNLDENSLAKMDKLCEKLNMNRAPGVAAAVLWKRPKYPVCL